MNKLVNKNVPEELREFVKPALDEFKRNVIRELGLGGSDKLSREDRGRVGGEMVKRMVLFGKCVLVWKYRERIKEMIKE